MEIPKTWRIGTQVTDTCRIHSEHFGYTLDKLTDYSENELRLVAYDCAVRMCKSFRASFYEVDARELYKKFLAYFNEQFKRTFISLRGVKM